MEASKNEPVPRDQLDSWKEIAAHLDRTVRTVQRWERQRGLPVYRHQHLDRGTVFAFRSELDAWMAAAARQEKKPRRSRWVVAFSAAVAVAILAGIYRSGSLSGEVAGLGAAPLVHRLFLDPGSYYLMGRVSFGGGYLSYSDAQGDLALLDLASRGSRVLAGDGGWWKSRNHAYSSAVSPEGDRVAYGWNNVEGSSFDIRVIDVGAAEPRILTARQDVADIGFLDWSLDGGSVLVHFTTRDRIHHMASISVENGEERTLKQSETDFPLGMSASPDGRLLVYDWPAPDDAANRELYLMDLLSREEKQLVSNPGVDAFPLFTPDGEAVVFLSDRSGALGIWRVELDDGASRNPPRLLHNDLGRAEPLGLTRDGAYYYYLEAGAADVFLAETDPESGEATGAPTPVASRFSGTTKWADWSPDGEFLAYESTRGYVLRVPGAERLIVRSLRTGEETSFSTDLTWMGRMRWSPEGRSIYIKGYDRKARRGLFRVDLASGTLETVFLNESFGRFEPALDGRSVLYAERGRIFRHDLETGRAEPIEGASGELFTLSPDGRTLALSRWIDDGETSCLSVVPTSGGMTRAILELEGLLRPQAWSPDGESILFTRDEDDETGLWRVSSEGGAPESMGLSREGLREVRVHPDGARISFIAGWPSREVWAVDSLLVTVRAESSPGPIAPRSTSRR